MCLNLTHVDTNLLITLLTVVGVGPFQQIPFNILLQRLEQVLVVADIDL